MMLATMVMIGLLVTRKISMICSDSADVDDEVLKGITPCRSAFYAIKGIRVENGLS